MQWVSISLLLCGGYVYANDDGTVFLERGQRGIVPCPLIESGQIPPRDVGVMHWYYGSTDRTSMLISYSFERRASPQNGIPEGVYYIDSDFNLIIANVTASNEGTYYFKLKPHFQTHEKGHIEVCEKVSPRRSYPTVIGCNQDHDADTCEAKIRHDSAVHQLNCVMEQVKPAVELRWIRVSWGRSTELKASTAVRPVNPTAYMGSSMRSNTYSTEASVQVPSVDDDAEYICEATGVAVGSSTSTRVRLTNTRPTTPTHNRVQFTNNPGTFCQANTDGTVFLERGLRGIVPCPLIKSHKFSPENVDAMYWYYGSIRRTSLLISYFLGRVAAQNGISDSVYDIDNEFNLVIENVSASNEGTYYFEIKPHLKMIESGKVNICDKVSPSQPYPTVIGCHRDQNADTCEARIQHNSTVHSLTCVMEQVKPAVELRWIRVSWGRLTELKTSITVKPVALPAYMGSTLRNDTYSTSASVQVAAVDDEEVYVCMALGVAVGRHARMIVRFIQTHPTTATYDEVPPSNYRGTTFVFADKVPSTVNKLAENRASVTELSVSVVILVILSVMMSVGFY